MVIYSWHIYYPIYIWCSLHMKAIVVWYLIISQNYLENCTQKRKWANITLFLSHQVNFRKSLTASCVLFEVHILFFKHDCNQIVNNLRCVNMVFLIVFAVVLNIRKRALRIPRTTKNPNFWPKIPNKTKQNILDTQISIKKPSRHSKNPPKNKNSQMKEPPKTQTYKFIDIHNRKIYFSRKNGFQGTKKRNNILYL